MQRPLIHSTESCNRPRLSLTQPTCKASPLIDKSEICQSQEPRYDNQALEVFEKSKSESVGVIRNDSVHDLGMWLSSKNPDLPQNLISFQLLGSSLFMIGSQTRISNIISVILTVSTRNQTKSTLSLHEPMLLLLTVTRSRPRYVCSVWPELANFFTKY